MDDELRQHLTNLGKGMVQANMRLNRVLNLIETGGPTGKDEVLDWLLDLLDATGRTLEESPNANPGLALVSARITEQLGGRHIRQVPASGRHDPLYHRVVETRITTDPALDRVIAEVLRPGWVRHGTSPEVIRFAQVAVWRLATEEAR